MIKTAIVDDEDSSAQILADYIERYARESGEDFEIERFADGDEITADYKPVFHIIFLDIHMKRVDGLRAAEFIRRLDKDVILIFVTNMAQYAVKGYAVDALDFLLKPVGYFAVSRILKRSAERVKKMRDNFLLLPTDSGTVRMNLAEVAYIESFRNKMSVHTVSETYSLSATLTELEKKLADKHFFRCNKSYLVNLAFVKAVRGNTAVVGKCEISLGRGRKKPFMDALIDFNR
ncbi:MAG: LytTR family DNA-binding domain-containing protein [Clostridiales bacterium]|jgi:DNA-binding LytR/AlgR family response regulator|nr:LytTR family DNA-binding domain-containing protein [Clostridiales bacterium]